MRDGVSLVDHESDVAIDVLQRVEFRARVAWNQRAHGAIRPCAMSGDEELAIPLAGIFWIQDRHSMPGRGFVPRNAFGPRAG